MDISTAFPSKFLKAADLGGKTYKLIMKGVEMEDIGGDHQPVLYFMKTDKGVVLNKTNMNAIAGTYGFETNNWAGKEVEIFPATTMFKGQNVPCIRLRVVTPAAAAGALPGQPVFTPSPTGPATMTAAPTGNIQPSPLGGLTDLNDDSPF